MAMAFFVMPPRFSFAVADPTNLLVLAGYCAFGIFLTARIPRPAVTPIDLGLTPNQPAEAPCRLVDVLAEIPGVKSTDRLARLSEHGVGALPCRKAVAVAILNDIVAEANRCGTTGIEIFPTRTPGVRGLSVVARRSLPPEGEVIAIGRRPDQCE